VSERYTVYQCTGVLLYTLHSIVQNSGRQKNFRATLMMKQ